MNSLKHSHVLCVALAGVLMAGSVAASGADGQKLRAGHADNADKTVVYQGVQVAIDPATGLLREPTAAQRQKLSAAMAQQQALRAGAGDISRPQNELEARATLKRNPRGVVGMSMQVPENQMNYLTAERQSDGSVAIHHRGEKAAAKAKAVIQ